MARLIVRLELLGEEQQEWTVLRELLVKRETLIPESVGNAFCASVHNTPVDLQ